MRALPKSAVERAPRTLKGTSEQVILVRLPVPGMFREAVFFLHEDYLRRELASALPRVDCVCLTPEHMTGKTVSES